MRRRINLNGLMAKPALEADEVQVTDSTTEVKEEPTAVTDPAPAAAEPAADPVVDPTATAAAPDTPAADAPVVETPPLEEKVAEPPAAEATPETAVPVTPAAAEPAPGAELPDMSDTVEVGLNESAELENDVGQIVEDTNAAVEVAECLESLRDVLKASVPEGGIDQYSAGGLKIAVESLHKSIGVDGYVFPSAEKFATISGRQRYTQVAMEGLGDTLKKIWDAIVRVVKASVEWLVERFQLLFTNAEKIQARARELAERANRVKHKFKSSPFKNAGFVKALQIDGKVDVKKAAEVLSKEVDATLGHFKGYVTVYDALLDLLGRSTDFDPVMKAVLGFTNQLNVLENPSGAGLSLPSGTSVVRRGNQLPGGKAVVAYIAVTDGAEKDIEEITKRILATKVEVTDAYPKAIKDADGDQELEMLAPPEVRDLAYVVIRVTNSIEHYKKMVEAMKTTKKRIIERAEAQAKAADSEKLPEGAKAAQSLAKLAPWAMRAVEQPCMGFNLYALNTCKTLLDYGTISLKNNETSQRESHDSIDQKAPLATRTQEKAAAAAA